MTIRKRCIPFLLLLTTFAFIGSILASDVIKPDSLPDAYVGQGYSVQLYWENTQPPISWSVISGTLPSGLTLDGATGLLSGKPTDGGTYQFTVRASKSYPTGVVHTEKVYALTVRGLDIYPDSLSDAIEEVNYNAGLVVTAGSPPYIWSVIGLPQGLTWVYLNPQTRNAIRIRGIPEVGTRGNYSIQVSVEDSEGRKASRRYMLEVKEHPWTFDITLTRLTEEGNDNSVVVYLDSLVLNSSVREINNTLFHVRVSRTHGSDNKSVGLQLIAPSGVIVPAGITMSISPYRGYVGDSNFSATISIRIDRRYPHLNEEKEIALILRTSVSGVTEINRTIILSLKGLKVDLRILFVDAVQVVSTERGLYTPIHKVDLVQGKSTVFNMTLMTVIGRIPKADLSFKLTLELPKSEWDWDSPDRGSTTTMYADVMVTVPRADIGTLTSAGYVKEKGVAIIRSPAPKPKYVHFSYPDSYTGPRRTTGTVVFTVEIDADNNIVEIFEGGVYIDSWYVKRTRDLKLLFIPWASGYTEYNCVWRDFYPSQSPPNAIRDNDDYLYYSHTEDDVNYGLWGAWTPTILIVFPSVPSYASAARLLAASKVEYLEATYPVSDDGVTYSVVTSYTLVAQNDQWVLEEVARRAKIWLYDAGVAYRIAGSGGQSRDVKWSVFVDFYAADATLAHELYHLMGPMRYDDYRGLPSSPGYWASMGEVRGIGETYFMAGFGINYPGTLIGGTNDSSRSSPPFFSYDWQSSHWIQREMYERLMYGWFNPLTSRDPLAVLVSGVVFRNGSAFFQPFVVQQVEDVDLFPDSKGDYVIAFIDKDGRTISSSGFNATFAVTGDPIRKETDRSYFAYYVELMDGVKKIELRDSFGKVMASQSITENSPSLKLDFPIGGEELTSLRNQTYSISWSASDPDGDTLYYYVAVSPDNGTNWIPLATDLKENKFLLDARLLEPGVQYIVNIKASDGFNTNQTFSGPFSIGPYVELDIVSELGGTEGSGWYLKGEEAKVSILFTKKTMGGILGMLGGYYEFDGWTGDLVSESSSAKIVMDSDKTVKANFRADYSMPLIYTAAVVLILLVAAFLIYRRRKGVQRISRQQA